MKERLNAGNASQQNVILHSISAKGREMKTSHLANMTCHSHSQQAIEMQEKIHKMDGLMGEWIKY